MLEAIQMFISRAFDVKFNYSEPSLKKDSREILHRETLQLSPHQLFTPYFKLFPIHFSPVEVKDVPSEVIDFMVETTTKEGDKVGKFLNPVNQAENDFNSQEFEEEFHRDGNKIHEEEISINKPEINSCDKNVIYYKPKSNSSEMGVRWNWTIDGDEKIFLKNEKSSVNFR